ncbi:MAG: phage holin family protein [Alphaproteobacteria bacterium]
MSEPAPPLIDETAAERSLIEDVRQLVDDGRTLVEAELAYQKSRAVIAGMAAKSIAGWVLLALALFFFALMALVLGLILVLEPAVGPMGATLAVFSGLLAMGTVSGLVAVRRWKRASALLSDEGSQP